MNVLDLFSGIGGFSLGLERAGMRTVAFCEINPYCRRVLAKHWPGITIYDDVRELSADRLRTDGISVDVICGGFPCQDLSVAQGASRAGLDGKRSGLWSEYARLIRELRPRFIIVENVPGLLSLGVGTVLGDLAEIGYDAEWQIIPAAAVGAPHIRDRFWLVGYSNGDGQPTLPIHDETSGLSRLVADSGDSGQRQLLQSISEPGGRITPHTRSNGEAQSLAEANGSRLEIILNGQAGQCAPAIGAHAWSFEPDVGRVAYGISDRAHRISALGNSVVPQIPEIIGRAIMTKRRATQLPSQNGNTKAEGRT